MTKRIEHKKYSGEFKIKVVEDMKESYLTCQEAADKHGVKNKTQVRNWERIYLEVGPTGLLNERRGQKTGPNKGRPLKLDKKVEEDLIEEVQRLKR